MIVPALKGLNRKQSFSGQKHNGIHTKGRLHKRSQPGSDPAIQGSSSPLRFRESSSLLTKKRLLPTMALCIRPLLLKNNLRK
jgi:hypothetical protein